MTKVLCVHQGAELYGSDRSFVQSLEGIRETFHDAQITVVLPENGPLVNLIAPISDEIIIEPVGKVSRKELKRNPIKKLKQIVSESFKAYLNIKKFDLVYVNTIVPFSYMIAMIFCKKIRILHVREIPHSKLESLIFSLYFTISQVKLIFNSHKTKASFYFLNNRNATVIQNGVEKIKVPPVRNISDEGPINILLVGRINSWKGQMIAVEACSLMVDRGINLKLRIVGDPPPRQRDLLENLNKSIDELKLKDHVDVFSFSNDVALHYEWAQIVLVPSIRPEPFGRVATEAMSAGRPLCASDCGGLSEILTGSASGTLVPPNDASAIASAIQYYADNPDVFQQHATRGPHVYAEKFSGGIYISNIKKYFTQLVGLSR